MERPESGDSAEFLKLVSRRERGKLKVYIGSAAGVGKTYRMLTEARALKQRGVDVVVGFIETQGRAETAALLEGLESVPTRSIEYRGVTLREMDVDAVIARKPTVVLLYCGGTIGAQVNALGDSLLPRLRKVLRALAMIGLLYTLMNALANSGLATSIIAAKVYRNSQVFFIFMGIAAAISAKRWIVLSLTLLLEDELDVSRGELARLEEFAKHWSTHDVPAELRRFLTRRAAG
jgi:hypothetical protein